jgi:hypothetical protein
MPQMKLQMSENLCVYIKHDVMGIHSDKSNSIFQKGNKQ